MDLKCDALALLPDVARGDPGALGLSVAMLGNRFTPVNANIIFSFLIIIATEELILPVPTGSGLVASTVHFTDGERGAQRRAQG